MSFPVVVPVDRQDTLPAWVGPVVVAAVIQSALFAGYLARFGGDPAALVCAGTDAIGTYPYEHLRVGMGKEGFEGQYDYALARDPWHAQDPRAVPDPAPRQVRLLYPALAWAASGGGDPQRLLWALPAINLLAIAGLAAFGAVFAVRFHRSPWWGLLLPLVLNATTPALRDLADPLALFCGFALLAAWFLRGHAVVLALLAAAAALSREQNVVLVGIVLLAAMWRRNWGTAAGLVLVLAAWAGWVYFLWQTYGRWPLDFSPIGFPFAGVLARFDRLSGDQASGAAPIHALGLAFVGVQVLISLALPLFRAKRTVTLTAWAGAALAVCGTAAVYMDGHSYTRAFALMPLGIWLWTVHSGRTWPALLLSPALLWPCYAVFQVWRR